MLEINDININDLEEDLNSSQAKKFEDPIVHGINVELQDILHKSSMELLGETYTQKQVKEKFKALQTVCDMNNKDIYVATYKSISSSNDLEFILFRLKHFFGQNLNLNWIDVSNLKNLNFTFPSDLVCDVSHWDVSNVTEMFRTFAYVTSSNIHGIEKWDVSNVKNFRSTFFSALVCSNIRSWKTTSAEDMFHMFDSASFNDNDAIKDFVVSNVKSMHSMFTYSDFNGDISQWDVSNVQDMCSMFDSSDFNGDISQWNTKSVTDMSNMFYGGKFTQNINNWDISCVKKMQCMFFANTYYNHLLSNWANTQANTDLMFSEGPNKTIFCETRLFTK